MKTTTFVARAASLAIALGLIVGGFAIAATPRTREIPHISPERFYDLRVSPSAFCSVDFGSLNPKQQNLTAPCAESSTCPALGQNGAPAAAYGDICLASTDMGSDGGSVLPLTADISCRPVTDGVVFKLCVNFTDGGVYDAPASNFSAIIIKR